MKKSILTFAIAIISICVFAQPVGIKLKSAEEFTVMPAQTVMSDSLFATVHDMGTYLYVNIDFFKGDKNLPASNMMLTLWEGDAYKQNENWSNATVIARIKVLLDIQK